MAPDGASATAEEAVSPTNKANMEGEIQKSITSMDSSINSLEIRADPDAQSTVTDFLDFTEYLPSDMVRSLTLIGKLDQGYTDASLNVHRLASTWGQLPTMPSDERPAPVEIRAEISEAINHIVNSRAFSHAEAVRMSDNVTRHYHRAKTILSKLQTMLEKYPTAEEQKSPVAVSKSPPVAKAPKPAALGPDRKRIRRPMVPRITVPGEVLAPYDNFEPYSSDSDDSSDEDEIESIPHRTPGAATPAPRIKVVKTQKTPNKAARPPKPTPSSASRPLNKASSSVAVATSGPAEPPPPPPRQPPDNAVIGSADAPWLQLTAYELARLRKRMKKNATWTPSDAMIARELNDLGRGITAYREAKKKAEEEGKAFEQPPSAVAAESSGNQKVPEGALSAAALSSEGVPASNKGMKLNEAKRQKRESLAKQAAEEAEESTRRFNDVVRKFIGTPQQPHGNNSNNNNGGSNGSNANGNGNGNGNGSGNIQSKANNSNAKLATKSTTNKRKRDSVTESDSLKPDLGDASASRPPVKRTKTETPVPLPQLRASLSSQPLTETPVPPPVLTPNGSTVTTQSTTPVPVPVPGHDHAKRTASPALAKETTAAIVLTPAAAAKPPTETPVPLPVMSPKKSTTPILPPVREPSKRETRGDAAKKTQHQHQHQVEVPPQAPLAEPQVQAPQEHGQISAVALSKQASSRSSTPIDLANLEGIVTRTRPGSRGKTASQEPPSSSLAADRPRRSSTARNTPVPEAQPGPKKTRRPAPGPVNTTPSGASSAVGRRKKAPNMKRRVKSQKKDNGQTVEEMEEVDDEGKPIDPNEPRYCYCDRVSFGTMISCDNQNCATEWFHLECVSLTAIPPRTTKWYCPDCRVSLKIGEKGEVSARGVKT